MRVSGRSGDSNNAIAAGVPPRFDEVSTRASQRRRSVRACCSSATCSASSHRSAGMARRMTTTVPSSSPDTTPSPGVKSFRRSEPPARRAPKRDWIHPARRTEAQAKVSHTGGPQHSWPLGAKRTTRQRERSNPEHCAQMSKRLIVAKLDWRRPPRTSWEVRQPSCRR